MSLIFLSGIYNGEISLKEAEFKQRDLEKEIENLQFYYLPKNKEEKEKIEEVLRYANESLEYKDKIINAFKNGTFSSEYLKKSDDVAYDFMLKGVNKFIEEIKSMEKKINLSLFEDFFGFASPADYAKELINIKNVDKSKGIVEEIEDRISDLENRIKEINEKEKKTLRRHYRLLEKFLIIIKMLKVFFIVHQKLIKENQNQRLKKVLQRGRN